jgi:phage shock protein A
MGRPPIGKTAMSGAERMRRLRAKRPVTKPVTKPDTADTAKLEARIHELEDELARERDRRESAEAKAKTAAHQDAGALEDRLKRFEIENAMVRKALRVAEAHAKKLQEAKPRAPRPVMPESEAVARLNKTIKELRSEIKHIRQWHDNEMSRKGKMPLETFRAVVRCLHPQSRGDATPKQIDEACGLFMEWKKDQDKAKAP